MAGSYMQGPIIWTASPQSVCGYSNVLFPARHQHQWRPPHEVVQPGTGGAPAIARISLPRGNTVFSIMPITTGRSAASRSRPSTHAGQWSQAQPEGRYAR